MASFLNLVSPALGADTSNPPASLDPSNAPSLPSADAPLSNATVDPSPPPTTPPVSAAPGATGNAPTRMVAPESAATDPEGSNSQTTTQPPGPEVFPDIEAKTYPVKTLRRSNSTRTYLFEDTNAVTPTIGRIFLLKKEKDSVMAFRVLKNYPNEKKFAAKRVRWYSKFRVLDAGTSYTAVEKISDRAAPPPSSEDLSDIKELESNNGSENSIGSLNGGVKGIYPSSGGKATTYDPELDNGTSPPPSGSVDSENADANVKPTENGEDFDEFEERPLSVEEVFSLDQNNHWLTGGLNLLRNNAVGGSTLYYSGGGIRYGLTLTKMLFLRKAQIQDSLVVEAGLFFYKIINFYVQNDAYTIVPLIGTLRYNIQLSESLSIFVYGGVMKNYVTSTTLETADVKSALSSILPAGGGGLLFRVGPSWDARIDLGIDTVGLGIVLRF